MLGEHLPGTLAEYIVVPATNVRAIPTTLPFEEAAAFTLATLTAWRMVVTRARVQPGEDVLIWGIGGGVALAALQICKQIGARTWVVSGSDDKLRRARRVGRRRSRSIATTVDVARDDPRAHEQARRRRRRRQRRARRPGTQSLLALGRRGRLVTCGATSGPIVETDVRRLFWNQWSILGSTMGNDAEFDAVVAELRAGRLLPPSTASIRSPTGAPRSSDSRAASSSARSSFGSRERRRRRVTSPTRSARSARRTRAASRRSCPRDGTTMTVRSIGGGSFGLGYARKREWLICPTCKRSVIFDVKRGTRN